MNSSVHDRHSGLPVTVALIRQMRIEASVSARRAGSMTGIIPRCAISRDGKPIGYSTAISDISAALADGLGITGLGHDYSAADTTPRT